MVVLQYKMRPFRALYARFRTTCSQIQIHKKTRENSTKLSECQR